MPSALWRHCDTLSDALGDGPWDSQLLRTICKNFALRLLSATHEVERQTASAVENLLAQAYGLLCPALFDQKPQQLLCLSRRQRPQRDSLGQTFTRKVDQNNWQRVVWTDISVTIGGDGTYWACAWFAQQGSEQIKSILARPVQIVQRQ